MKRLLFLFSALLSLAACTNTPDKIVKDIQGIDSSLKPGDNFFSRSGIFIIKPKYAG